MRILDESFLSDLKDGYLADLTATVRSGATLCLELRGDRVNVYYRGGSLMELRRGRQPEGEHSVSFDTNYFAAGEEIELPDRAIRNRDDLARWLTSWPGLKRAMDSWPSQTRDNAEKEFQQLAARENNFGSVARDTDYYVCDIEYQSGQGRFDMIAVHWPSESAVRKHTSDRRLVFVEVKYGDSALNHLHAHVRDVNDFAADPHRLENFKQDMVGVFNQKWELGLINCGKKLQSFSGERPLMLLVFANHDPQKSTLSRLLHSLPASPHVGVSIATASFLGYGLYEHCIHPVQTVLKRFGDYVLAPGRFGVAVPGGCGRAEPSGARLCWLGRNWWFQTWMWLQLRTGLCV